MLLQSALHFLPSLFTRPRWLVHPWHRSDPPPKSLSFPATIPLHSSPSVSQTSCINDSRAFTFRDAYYGSLLRHCTNSSDVFTFCPPSRFFLTVILRLFLVPSRQNSRSPLFPFGNITHKSIPWALDATFVKEPSTH